MSSIASSLESPATSVNQTRASIPVALRMARISRRSSGSGIHVRKGDSASLIHPMARPCRSSPGACSAAFASRESRSIVRCCGSVSATRRVKASMTASRRAAGIVGSLRQEQRGCLDLGMRGDEQRSLIGEVPVRCRPGDGRRHRRFLTVGVIPWATSLRAAAMSAPRVRCFCPVRPDRLVWD